MKEYVLERRTKVPRPLVEVFPFFAAAENLARITPPELGFRIRSTTPLAMRVGALIDYTIKLWGLPFTWRPEITAWDPPHSFEHTQRRGPYAIWVHRHSCVEDVGGTTMIDRVTYALPLGFIGRIVHPLIKRQ